MQNFMLRNSSCSRVTITNNTLTLSDAGPGDVGFYQCSAYVRDAKYQHTYGAQLTIACKPYDSSLRTWVQIVQREGPPRQIFYKHSVLSILF